jgi:hypothetical protein
VPSPKSTSWLLVSTIRFCFGGSAVPSPCSPRSSLTRDGAENSSQRRAGQIHQHRKSPLGATRPRCPGHCSVARLLIKPRGNSCFDGLLCEITPGSAAAFRCVTFKSPLCLGGRKYQILRRCGLAFGGEQGSRALGLCERYRRAPQVGIRYGEIVGVRGGGDNHPRQVARIVSHQNPRVRRKESRQYCIPVANSVDL